MRQLLYINPKLKKDTCINDQISSMMQKLLDNAVITNRWRGWHTCICGECSSSCDYNIQGTDIEINNLCVHYLIYHRSEIPEEDWKIVMELYNKYWK